MTQFGLGSLYQSCEFCARRQEVRLSSLVVPLFLMLDVVADYVERTVVVLFKKAREVRIFLVAFSYLAYGWQGGLRARPQQEVAQGSNVDVPQATDHEIANPPVPWGPVLVGRLQLQRYLTPYEDGCRNM
jgi:hypothetical protein